jgi:hypothetical protein
VIIFIDFGHMEFAVKIIISCMYKLPDNFYGSFHVFSVSALRVTN